jgi:predicted ATPase/class 3 adenylate cyclase/DNA-binding CsgD family transcriptional regulator
MGEGATRGLGAGALPDGTVTFLFTDLEGSTRLLQAHPDAYRAAVARHHILLQSAIEAHGGAVFETVGDAVYAAFERPTDAVAAALAGQVALREETWGELGPGAVRVRMGLHTGEVEVQGAHYFGLPLYRCARLTAAAHGSQVVLSGATAELVRDALPGETALRDLGAHRLKDLARPELVFQLVDGGGPADFPALRSLDALPHNLPVLRDPLVGREAELGQVEQFLLRQDVGLLTLTGPGGTGKTRLALQAAADLADRFEDGVVFVALAPIREPDLVLPAVAAALGVRDAGARPLRDLVHDHLRPRRLLLLLDNFEQVLGAAPLVADLLAAATRLTVLVTSRAVLRLSGEHEYPVPPLGVPGPGRLPSPGEVGRVDAVRLFVERARAARPDFALTEENAPAVAEVCRRLDGLPLALELAAARVRVLPPQALLARLTDHHGPAALRLLTGGARDLPARQQTLRDTIAWSYGLLTEDDRALFRRLGVFVGGCTLGDAEGVVLAALASPGGAAAGSDVVEGVTSLVEKSLLQLEVGTEGLNGEPRFRMLETVREYALEQLAAAGEEEAVRRAHAAHYLALAEEAERGAFGAAAVAWLDRLEPEHDNLRAALRWALDHGETETALRFGGALWQFWYTRGYLGDGSRWLEETLGAAGLLDGGRNGTAGAAGRATPRRIVGAAIKALNGAGVLAHYQGDYGRAAVRCGESLALARRHQDKAGTATALDGLALVARSGGDYATARTMYQEAIAIQEELGDTRGLTHSLFYSAVLLWGQGECAAARRVLEDVLPRAAGDTRNTGGILTVLGFVRHAQGDHDAAADLLRESLRLCDELRDTRGRARSTWGLGRALLGQGHVVQAHACLLESSRLFDEIGDRLFFSTCLDGLAEVALALGQPRCAARLLGAAQSILERIGAVRLPVNRGAYEQGLTEARRALGEEGLAAALAAGRALTPDQALAAARALGEAPRPASSPRAAASPASPPRAGPDGAGAPLSAREREVARLIARGLTNKQIAAELIIAEGTADRHVSNILGKLGFATRAQVAAWATERVV